MASRYDLRSIVVQTLFEIDFRNSFEYDQVKNVLRRNFNERFPEKGKDVPEFAEKLALGILSKKDVVDQVLTKSAPDWPLEKIDNMARTILRLGIYELLFGEELGTPKKVAINEAIEMAKAYGGDGAKRFINGVLATVYKELENTSSTEVK
jgi:N utilization substance protein B